MPDTWTFGGTALTVMGITGLQRSADRPAPGALSKISLSVSAWETSRPKYFDERVVSFMVTLWVPPPPT